MIMSAIAWKTVGAIAGGVVLAGSALGAIGLQLPQIATKDEVQEVREWVAQVDLKTSQDALDRANQDLLKWEYEAQRKEEEYQRCLDAGHTDCKQPETVRKILRLQKKTTRGLSDDIRKLLQGKKP